MRLAKLSLAAIVALGVSAFADVENVKFGGDAKLYYATVDADNEAIGLREPGDMFSPNNSAGQAALDLWATADVGDGAKAKIAVTMLSTLGLENNFVSQVWDAGLENQWWVSEAWLAKSFGNTTVKLGRQELDTPLAFTEKWSISENTYDAAVVLNSDLPQTILVGAWVGRTNLTDGATGYAGVTADAKNGTDSFDTFAEDGAYAFAAITKLIPMTTAQVWYYDVQNVAKAWWLQADVDLKEALPGLGLGLQYANINPDASGVDDSSAWAIKLGYAFDALKVSAAYSSTDEDGVVPIQNVGGQQSKLYTEAWWNYGYVGANDVDAWMISAEYSMEGIADFYAQYTAADAGKKSSVEDMTEFTLTASKSFGSLDATLAYIYTDADDQNVDPNTNKADSYNTIQVYLTYNF